MSLSPETRERLALLVTDALRRTRLARTAQGLSRDSAATDAAYARAALAVVLDDPQVTITERTAVPPHHHEYVGGRCYRCGLASPTQWIGALDGRPVNPENETSSDGR